MLWVDAVSMLVSVTLFLLLTLDIEADQVHKN